MQASTLKVRCCCRIQSSFPSCGPPVVGCNNIIQALLSPFILMSTSLKSYESILSLEEYMIPDRCSVGIMRTTLMQQRYKQQVRLSTSQEQLRWLDAEGAQSRFARQVPASLPRSGPFFCRQASAGHQRDYVHHV